MCRLDSSEPTALVKVLLLSCDQEYSDHEKYVF